jgi:ABC-2 type transport system permease protein
VQNVLAIARRELGAYFDSPLAYFIVPIYVLLVGGFALWFDDVFAAGTVTLRGVFFWSGLFLLLLVPAVTMRLFAEERRTGSIELLTTLPLTESELVAGKYLAALVMVAVALASTLPYPLMFAVLGLPPAGDDVAPTLLRIFTETNLDWGPALGGYFGLFLLGAALAALGTAASSVTSNQIVAYLLAVVLSVFPWVAGMFLDKVPADVLPLVQYLTFTFHFDNLARGVLDTRDFVYWGALVGLCLHIAVWSLERRRLA